MIVYKIKVTPINIVMLNKAIWQTSRMQDKIDSFLSYRK